MGKMLAEGHGGTPISAGRMLARARTRLDLSMAQVAARMGITSYRWVQWIENDPPCPLSNHRRVWALLDVLGIDPGDYLEALGLPARGKMWRP